MEKEVARKKFRQVLQDEISKASGMKFSVDLKDKPKATPRVIHALGIEISHVTHRVHYKNDSAIRNEGQFYWPQRPCLAIELFVLLLDAIFFYTSAMLSKMERHIKFFFQFSMHA